MTCCSGLSLRYTCSSIFKRALFHFSQGEAHRWQVRASSLFEQPDRHHDRICKEYVNLAVKYTPVYSNVTLSFLLCLRSKVEQRLGDYARGLEDAKNALKMTPTMLEVNILNFTVHTAIRWRIRHNSTLLWCKMNTS